MSSPSYLALHANGELAQRIARARAQLAACTLCPRGCAVDRMDAARGVCGTGRKARVASYQPHFGEEAPLVGTHGSGTIFFCGCNLLCSFCQNYDISHCGVGQEVGPEQLGTMMAALARRGCHNINLVTPTHVTVQILEALPHAIARGLSVPLVYNCGGYESVETLRLLDGVVDIYLSDFKFWEPRWSERYCGVSDYRERATAALGEMQRQVGDLKLDDKGVAVRGLLVRHLVMPHGIAGTPQVMAFIAEELSAATYVNVMAQYRPCGEAMDDDILDRAMSRGEYDAAVLSARRAGLTRLD